METKKLTFEEYIEEVSFRLDDRFDLTLGQIDEIIYDKIDYINDAFYRSNGYQNVDSLIDDLKEDGKLKWRK